jgi:hypothetical protein
LRKFPSILNLLRVLIMNVIWFCQMFFLHQLIWLYECFSFDCQCELLYLIFKCWASLVFLQ